MAQKKIVAAHVVTAHVACRKLQTMIHLDVVKVDLECCICCHDNIRILQSVCVGVESDQQVNICSFSVHCDRRWPNTQ